MLSDLTNEKSLKTVFAYPICPQHMGHPIMVDICKLCSSFTVNFNTSKVDDPEQIVGWVFSTLQWYSNRSSQIALVYCTNYRVFAGA